ncbi:hypothetical protein B566_EDAN007752 [Ephemera danica]|nr:hypothetical protein B566_EDAN007752 [Ephemera danica]
MYENKMKLYIFLLYVTLCISHGSSIVCMSCTLSDLACNNPKHPEITIHNVTCESNDAVNKPACYKIQATIAILVSIKSMMVD